MGNSIYYHHIYISIHAAQEGCDLIMTAERARHLISIHAAQEGCDVDEDLKFYRDMAISIHAAQEGCDPRLLPVSVFNVYFNPRSPRGLRPYYCA